MTSNLKFTDEVEIQLNKLSEIRGCDTDALVTDIVSVFVSQVCSPIVKLPNTRADE